MRCGQVSSESIVFLSSSKSFKQQLRWMLKEFATLVKLCKPENFNCHLDAIYRKGIGDAGKSV